MNPTAIALLAQSAGLVYAAYKERNMDATLIGASMVVTYLSMRRQTRDKYRLSTLEGYVDELRRGRLTT